MADRVILAVKYTPASAPSLVRRAVGGFLRYVQYRDKHAETEVAPADPRVGGLLKYVAYRDQGAPQGRLFGPDGTAGNQERRDFGDFVARSFKGSKPHISRDARGELIDRRRAVYRFVLSPEHAEGLDLRQLTKTAVSRLEADTGGSALRWIAAEHRNTAHPHVHIVLAGMTETGPDQYRSLVLNRRRLAAMKEELMLEIQRQRGANCRQPQVPGAAIRPQLAAHPRPVAAALPALQARPAPKAPSVRTPSRPLVHRRGTLSAAALLRAAARRYRWRLERQAEEERRRGREVSRG
ncbi:MAG: hypothetical protein JF888_00560 [Candidatus Dormibacteraeota bacterium]|uniref:Relaxase n=1 Tax=Candidatus Dormiibacter inghamiae TaxID=3127013 RepID=A0A934NC85_9BACT|nr:hypothetical protein [Candidatus Dormibacteraeota bacterium]MBJ7607752.1 hypothetical protein [Candidatus Dormibacteraeota bacterium]